MAFFNQRRQLDAYGRPISQGVARAPRPGESMPGGPYNPPGSPRTPKGGGNTIPDYSDPRNAPYAQESNRATAQGMQVGGVGQIPSGVGMVGKQMYPGYETLANARQSQGLVPPPQSAGAIPEVASPAVGPDTMMPTSTGGYVKTPEGYFLKRVNAPPKFAREIYSATRQMNDADRASYVAGLQDTIRQRLAKYSYRVARGRQLTPAQQAEYDQLKQNLNDVTEFLREPQRVVDYMEGDKLVGNDVPGDPRSQFGKPGQWAAPGAEPDSYWVFQRQ